MFIAGNGFSMNFDKGFHNIYDNLGDAHNSVIYKTKYEINSGNLFKRKFYENWKAVAQYTRFFKEADIERIFEDGLEFSNSIVNNRRLLTLIKEKKVLTILTFKKSELDILKELQETGSTKGYKHVNVEHWTILIFFYYAIKKLCINGIYTFPENNSFLTLVRLGNSSNIQLIPYDSINSYATVETVSNGFNIYYKLLFINAIFNNGKAIDISKLDNIRKINVNKLRKFLLKYHILSTTNYDNTLESLTDRDVVYIHGRFSKNTKSYVFNQSIQLLHDNIKVDASDIIIGDYFTCKTFVKPINKLSASESLNNINKKISWVSDILGSQIKGHRINCISLFGMNVINDYHILRNLMIELYFAYIKGLIKEPKIIYFYYCKEDKDIFKLTFNEVITFAEELNDYVRNDIGVCYVSTKEILSEYF